MGPNPYLIPYTDVMCPLILVIFLLSSVSNDSDSKLHHFLWCSIFNYVHSNIYTFIHSHTYKVLRFSVKETRFIC